MPLITAEPPLGTFLEARNYSGADYGLDLPYDDTSHADYDSWFVAVVAPPEGSQPGESDGPSLFVRFSDGREEWVPIAEAASLDGLYFPDVGEPPATSEPQRFASHLLSVEDKLNALVDDLEDQGYVVFPIGNA